MQANRRSARPRVGFLPIGRVQTNGLQDEYERGINLAHQLDADIVESPLVWSQPQVLDGLADLQAQGIDILVEYVLHGMSSPQQTLAGAKSTVPVVLWALPTNYSFPSAANAVGVLRERGRRVKMVVSDADPDSVLPQLNMMARVAFTLARLRESRIGTLGDVFPNLTAAQYHPDVLADRLGPQVVHITLAQFNTFLSALNENDPAIDEEIRRLRASFDVRVEDPLLRKAIRVHWALRDVVQEHRLTAVALECHTELTPLFGINPCFGFADDNRDYLISGEGDVVMGVNMLMLQLLTRKEPYLGDIYAVQDGVLTLIHCGTDCRSARREEVVIMEQTAPDTVGLKTKMAMCVPNLAPGEVTVTRLHGQAHNQLHVALGEIIETDTRERLAVHVRLRNPQAYLEHVCGNHYLVSYGDLRPQLRLLCEWLDIDITDT